MNLSKNFKTVLMLLFLTTSGCTPADTTRQPGTIKGAPFARKSISSIQTDIAELKAPAMETSGNFTTAALVFNPLKNSVEESYNNLEKLIRQAATAGAELIVTPEFLFHSKHRYKMINKFRNNVAKNEKYLKRLQDLSRQFKIYLIVSLNRLRDGKIYNEAYVISDEGKIQGYHQKVHLANRGIEATYTEYGTCFEVIELPWLKIGITICYDRRFPESSRTLAIKGAQLIAAPSLGGDGVLNEAMLRTYAFTNRVYYVYSHHQTGLIIDPQETILAKSGREKQFAIAEIDTEFTKKGPAQSLKGVHMPWVDDHLYMHPETYIYRDMQPQNKGKK